MTITTPRTSKQPLKRVRSRLINYTDPESPVMRWRTRRMDDFREFLDLVEPQDPTVKHHVIRILDVGGTWNTWTTLGQMDPDKVSITVLNMNPGEMPPADSPINGVVGDARNLEYPDQFFDVIFSNSVIEHLPDPADQQKMSDEIHRVGRYHVVQTPAKGFWVDPHSWLPFFPYYPRTVRALLVRFVGFEWYPKQDTWAEAKVVADSIPMLTRVDMERLFPTSEIRDEKMLGRTKSFTAFGKPQEVVEWSALERWPSQVEGASLLRK